MLSSLLALDAGTVEVDGRRGRAPVAPARWRAPASPSIPEDRHDSGCVLDFTVAENLFLADPSRVARYGLMDHGDDAPAGDRS